MPKLFGRCGRSTDPLKNLRFEVALLCSSLRVRWIDDLTSTIFPINFVHNADFTMFISYHSESVGFWSN